MKPSRFYLRNAEILDHAINLPEPLSKPLLFLPRTW